MKCTHDRMYHLDTIGQKSYANGCHKSIGRRNEYLQVPLAGHEKMPETNDRQVHTAVSVKAKRTIQSWSKEGRVMLAPPDLWFCFVLIPKLSSASGNLQGQLDEIGATFGAVMLVVFFLSFFSGWRCLWTKSSRRIGKDHQVAKREKAGEQGKCGEMAE